jgi:hypothetical protein
MKTGIMEKKLLMVVSTVAWSSADINAQKVPLAVLLQKRIRQNR